MLALTRRIGEEIVIGDPAKPMGVIRVVSVHGDKVRLSFDFPKDVLINRRELAEEKAKMNKDKGACFKIENNCPRRLILTGQY